MADTPQLPRTSPGRERTVDYIARLTDEQLTEYQRQLQHIVDTASDKVPPKNVYQSAAYRRYRHRMTIQKIDDERRERHHRNQTDAATPARVMRCT